MNLGQSSVLNARDSIVGIFGLLTLLSLPCWGQQGVVTADGRVYQYSSNSERQLVDSLIRQRREIESIRARNNGNNEWRNPTQAEVLAMQKEWSANNPFTPTFSMPDFSRRKIKVDRSEELYQKLQEIENQLRRIEAASAQQSLAGYTASDTFETQNSRVAVESNESDEEAAMRRAEFYAIYTASEKRAVELYDFPADWNSAGSKRMVEIDETLRANNDPLFYDPNKPLIIAQMVAKELRIAPRSKPQTAQQVTQQDSLAALQAKASMGDAESQFQLGELFANGQGVKKDDAEAFRWYLLAGKQGHAEAQKMLGVVYANGQGVKKDSVESERWFRLWRAHFPTY